MSPDSNASRFVHVFGATAPNRSSARFGNGSDISAELESVGLESATEIGRGGFGTVYRCFQPTLDRSVAVKVLAADLDVENRERFLREEHAMGRLSGHPNIVDILQVGVTATGRPYILMPFHARRSLERVIKQSGPIAWPDAVRIGIKLAGAIESAHWMGILHRDVKPANVLVTAYDEPQLTDFGIARVPGSFETSSAVITGSPAYIAPEVLAGNPPTERSDVYGLGATLFTLVTGHAAYERRAGEGVMAHFLRITEQPVPDLRQLAVPEDLSAAIEVAMTSQPSERPRSAAEFGKMLQQIEFDHGLPTEKMALPGDVEQAKPIGRTNSSTLLRTAAATAVQTSPEIDRAKATQRSGELQRGPLIERLRSAPDPRVVAIVAPGGFGKSILASQWRDAVVADRQSTAWIRITEDTDSLSAMFESVLQVRPDLEKRNERDDKFSAQKLVAGLRASGEQLTLFIDGYDRVSDRAILAAIDYLLECDCAELKLVVTSRVPVPVSGPHIRIVDAEDLRFSREEAEELFVGVYSLPLSALGCSDLANATNGWPLALQLLAVSLRIIADTEGVSASRVVPGAAQRAGKAIRRLHGGAEAIPGFLVNNLLDGIQPRMADFLLSAAAGGSGGEIGEDPSSPRLLEEAQRRHLFVRPSTTDSAKKCSRQWLRNCSAFSANTGTDQRGEIARWSFARIAI